MEHQRPPRLADYFFQVGLSPASLVSSQILDSESMSDLGRKDDSHPIHHQYHPETLCRYPQSDYPGIPFPEFISMFCFPNDLKFELSMSDGKPQATFHSFVITGDMGVKYYGMVITTLEELTISHSSELIEAMSEWREKNLDPSEIEFGRHIQAQLKIYQTNLGRLEESFGMDPTDAELEHALTSTRDQIALFSDLLKPFRISTLNSTANVYVPRCIGLLSRLPWLDKMKDWLCEILQSYGSTGVPLERWMTHLIDEVPEPPPGKIEVAIPVGRLHMFHSNPSVNDFPGILGISLYPLLYTFSTNNILSFVELLLTERKILIVSSHLSMLTQVSEGILSLLFPFRWHHIYIPVLPARLLNYLQAPMPYLIGVHRDYFDSSVRCSYMPSDVVLVDIDHDKIELLKSQTSLPSREKRKLLSRLKSTLGKCIKPETILPKCFYEAFPGGKHVPRSCQSKRTAMHGQRRKSSFEPSVPLTAQGLVQSPTHIDDKVVPLSEVGLEIVPKVADEQASVTSSENLNGHSRSSSLNTWTEGSSTKEDRLPHLLASRSSTLSFSRKSFKSLSRSVSLFDRFKSATTLHRSSSEELNSFKPREKNVDSFMAKDGHTFVRMSLNGRGPSYINWSAAVGEDRLDYKANNSHQHSGPESIGPYLQRLSEAPTQKAGSCSLCHEVLLFHRGYLRCSDCNLSIHHDCLANTESCPCPSVYSDSQIRSSFLNVFTSILRNYKDFLIEASPQIYSSAETAMSLQSIFRVDDFLADLDSESRNFMDQVVHTQSFFEFIRERTGDIKYETLFLSETINNKLNRSKLQVQKLPTSFLDDNGYAIKATLVLTGPNTTGLELKSGVESSSFPLHLNLDLIAAPRNIPTLMSDSDVQLMELYTKGILFQGAFHVPYKVHDFGQWLRGWSLKTPGPDRTIASFNEGEKAAVIASRLEEITAAIYFSSGAHLSTLTLEELASRLRMLHVQHSRLQEILLEDHEGLEEQDETRLQSLYSQLFRILTLYEDHYQSLGADPTLLHPPPTSLPPGPMDPLQSKATTKPLFLKAQKSTQSLLSLVLERHKTPSLACQTEAAQWLSKARPGPTKPPPLPEDSISIAVPSKDLPCCPPASMDPGADDLTESRSMM